MTHTKLKNAKFHCKYLMLMHICLLFLFIVIVIIIIEFCYDHIMVHLMHSSYFKPHELPAICQSIYVVHV